MNSRTCTEGEQGSCPKRNACGRAVLRRRAKRCENAAQITISPQRLRERTERARVACSVRVHLALCAIDRFAKHGVVDETGATHSSGDQQNRGTCCNDSDLGERARIPHGHVVDCVRTTLYLLKRD